jgi:hypothetical protein
MESSWELDRLDDGSLVFSPNQASAPALCPPSKLLVPMTETLLTDIKTISQLNKWIQEREVEVQLQNTNDRFYKDSAAVLKHWRLVGVFRKFVDPQRHKSGGSAIQVIVSGRACVKNLWGTPILSGTRLYLVLRTQEVKVPEHGGQIFTTFRFIPYSQDDFDRTSGDAPPPLSELLPRNLNGEIIRISDADEDYQIGTFLGVGISLEGLSFRSDPACPMNSRTNFLSNLIIVI